MAIATALTSYPVGGDDVADHFDIVIVELTSAGEADTGGEVLSRNIATDNRRISEHWLQVHRLEARPGLDTGAMQPS